MEIGLWDGGGVIWKTRSLEVCLWKPWVRAKVTDPFIAI